MSEEEKKNDVNLWTVLSTVGKGVGKTVQLIAQGTTATVDALQEGQKVITTPMAVTEITSIFNTTDKTLKFVNRETPRDTKEILGQSAVSMKTENTVGAWVPWFDPPRFANFQKRHVAIIIDEIPVLYIWQKGDFVYWTNRLNEEGNPAKAYKMAGVAHVGGKRTLVIRNDPEVGYSAFLTNSV